MILNFVDMITYIILLSDSRSEYLHSLFVFCYHLKGGMVISGKHEQGRSNGKICQRVEKGEIYLESSRELQHE